MKRSIHIQLGDCALRAWGEALVDEMSGGLGFPSSSTEGRAMKNGSGRSSSPSSSIVPRIAAWQGEVLVTHSAVLAMPNTLARVAKAQYVDALIDATVAENTRVPVQMSERAYAAALHDCRLWAAAWITAFEQNGQGVYRKRPGRF